VLERVRIELSKKTILLALKCTMCANRGCAAFSKMTLNAINR
jgi:hypothetical protein